MHPTNQPPADDAQRAVDHYAVLGLRSDATADQVRAAFRRAARANHPDSQFGDMPDNGHDAMVRVNAAYAVLSDPHRRAQHDLSLRQQARDAAAPNRPAGRSRARGWALAGLALLTLGSAAAGWRILQPARQQVAAVEQEPAPAMRPATQIAPAVAPAPVPAPAPTPTQAGNDASETPLRLTSSRELRRQHRKVPKRQRQHTTVAGLSR